MTLNDLVTARLCAQELNIDSNIYHKIENNLAPI